MIPSSTLMHKRRSLWYPNEHELYPYVPHAYGTQIESVRFYAVHN
jgi:hypothetical protein